MIYGTVRLIERDDETFLAWARDRYACVIFNLHVEHTPAAIDERRRRFRGLIDLGLARGGSYYLTYHRWARRDQVERGYPQMPEFLALKRQYDPDEFFPEHLVPPLPHDVRLDAASKPVGPSFNPVRLLDAYYNGSAYQSSCVTSSAPEKSCNAADAQRAGLQRRRRLPHRVTTNPERPTTQRGRLDSVPRSSPALSVLSRHGAR